MRDIEALDPIGRLREIERFGQILDHFAGLRLHDAEAPFKGMAGVAGHELEQGAPPPSLGRQDPDRAAACFRQQFFQQRSVFEVHRDVDLVGQVLLVEVDLAEKGGKELTRVKVLEILPEELPPIKHTSGPHVK